MSILPRHVSLASLLVTLLGCGDKDPASPASSASAAAGASASAAAAPTGAPAAAEAQATVVEIAPRGGGDAAKVSVVLPPGVVDVSERPTMKQFRKAKDQFDGYALTLAHDEPARAKSGYEMTVALVEKENAANPAKKARLIDKSSGDAGWYVALEFEEGGKKNVSVMASTKVGDGYVMCRGDASGPVLTDPGPEAAAKVLVAACSSLKPAS